MNARPVAGVTDQMLCALPDDAHPCLVPDSGCSLVPASRTLDPEWMAEQIRLRGLIWGIDDPFVLATLWWYSASNWLILPTIASSFLTGSVLSPALDDVLLHWRPDSRIPGATSTRLATAPVSGALAEALGPVIEHVASICGKGERRLWSMAVDAIAGRYLWAGVATSRETEAQQAAEDVVSNLPGRLPQPRFQTVETRSDLEPRTFVRRGSCCLLYTVSGEVPCGNCPRQHPAKRRERLSTL